MRQPFGDVDPNSPTHGVKRADKLGGIFKPADVDHHLLDYAKQIVPKDNESDMYPITFTQYWFDNDLDNHEILGPLWGAKAKYLADRGDAEKKQAWSDAEDRARKAGYIAWRKYIVVVIY